PSNSNIRQANTFLDRLAVPTEQAQPSNSDARKLETFRGVHAQQSDSHPLCRNSISVIFGHIDGHLILGEHLSDPLPNPVLRIETSHLRPLVPRFFPSQKPLSDAVSLCIDAHTLPHLGFHTLPTGVFGQ